VNHVNYLLEFLLDQRNSEHEILQTTHESSIMTVAHSTKRIKYQNLYNRNASAVFVARSGR
jgi:hypothetical protein